MLIEELGGKQRQGQAGFHTHATWGSETRWTSGQVRALGRVRWMTPGREQARVVCQEYGRGRAPGRQAGSSSSSNKQRALSSRTARAQTAQPEDLGRDAGGAAVGARGWLRGHTSPLWCSGYANPRALVLEQRARWLGRRNASVAGTRVPYVLLLGV